MNVAVPTLVLLLCGVPCQRSGSSDVAPWLGHSSKDISAVRGACVVPPDAANRGDILTVLPAGAWAVMIVRDVAAFDEKVAPLVAKPGPPVRPLPFLKAWLGIVDGLDDHGSAAVVLMPVDEPQSMSQRLAIMLPTTDPAALMTLWNPQRLDDECFKVALAGRESFLAIKGTFSVIGPDLETIRAVVKSQNGLSGRLSVDARKRFGENDVFLWIDTAEIASSSFLGTYKPWFQESLGLGDDFLKSCESVQLAGRIDPEGLALGLRVEGTGTSANRASLNTTDSLLRGLPDERFVLAMGMVNSRSGADIESLGRRIVWALVWTRIIDAGRAPDVQRLYATMAPQIAAVSVSLSVPPQGADGLLGVTKVIRTRGDARMFMREIEAVVALLRSGLFVDPKLNALAEKLVYRRAAETCGDVTIDHLFIDVKDDEADEYAALKRVVGQEGLLLRIGAVDTKHVVITFGGGLSRFEAVVAGVRSGAAPLAGDPGIVKSAGHVAAERSLEAYFSVDRFVRVAPSLAAAMGMSVGFPDIPELDAPIAITVHTVGPRVTHVGAFIPTQVLAWPSAPPVEKPSGP